MASDALGEAFVVPFSQILQDIQNRLGAVSIRLPTRSDIPARNHGCYGNVGNPPSIDSGYHSMPSRSDMQPWNNDVYTTFPEPTSYDSGYHSTPSRSEIAPQNDSGYSSLQPSFRSDRNTESAPSVNPVPKKPSRLRRSLKTIFVRFVERMREMEV